jgi:AAA+ superfamily predicted ATPase
VSEDPLIASLSAAVEAAPGDVTLRLHLAELLVDRGHGGEAVQHCAVALSHDPGSSVARGLMQRALSGTSEPGSTPPAPAEERAPAAPPPPTPSKGGYDWGQAEAELGDAVPPMFVGAGEEGGEGTSQPDASAWDAESTTVMLADVGGMTHVKERLEAAFLAPMRNPELRRLYGKSLRGGLLLYGPPGCGKTFLARAVAGELGAKFISVGLADVLDMWIGQSERNIKELFDFARREAPVVLFLDEIDALGQKRSSTRNTAMRTAVNQLLTELDGVDGGNEGVFVLAATNQPWDVDPALRRPGRLDRTLLVLPPDQGARESILRYHLRQRPIEAIDVASIARRTEGWSGADLAHACETAAERALLDGVRSGTVRLIGMADLEAAVKEIRPSTGPWLQSARNVVEYGAEDDLYSELRDYLKKRRIR